MIPLGIRLYGLAAVATGLVGLAWGDFALQWQPVGAGFPGRTALAYVFALLLVLAGAAINVRRTRVFGATALSGLYGIVVVLMHGVDLAQHPGAFSAWSGLAEQAALLAGGLAAYAWLAADSAAGAEHFVAAGGGKATLLHATVVTMALCLLVFGAAHFRYLDFTAAMVPAWIPGGQRFWAIFTGAAHLAAGVALLTGVQARLAAILVTVMFAGFGLLVHLPLLLAQSNHLNWVMNAVNLSLTGAAWIIAQAVRQPHTRRDPVEAGVAELT